MKAKLRFTSLLLSLLLLASLWGCSLPGIGDESGAATSEKAATTLPPEDINVEETTSTEGIPYETETESLGPFTEPVPETTEGGYTFNDPEEITYNTTVKVLAWQDTDFAEFEVEYGKADESILSKAIYERFIKVEERLGVTLEFVYTNGNTSNMKEWNTYVSNCVSAALREYDFIAGGSMAIAKNAVSGLLCDLLEPEFETFNPSKPYFFESYGTDALIGSSLYFTTGSFSVNTLASMYYCYANTYLLQAYNLGDPRETVLNGEWTVDKFIEMCRGCYNDNGDALKNTADSFGYITSIVRSDAWYYASGARYCELDGSGKIALSSLHNTEDVLVLAERLAGLLHDSADGFMADKSDEPVEAFASGRSLFVTETLGMALGDQIQNAENLNYYLLPLPKYDLDQVEYYSTLANQHTLFAITHDCPDRERAAAVLTCFAQYGCEKILPAVYREALGSEYASSIEETTMFDIVRENIVYDHGRLFADELIGQNTDFRYALSDNAPQSVLTRLKAKQRALEKKLESLNDTFSKMN